MAEASQPVDSLALRLAERICAFDRSHASRSALEKAKAGIADTIAVTLAGTQTPAVARLRAVSGVASAEGPCVLFGTDRRTSALDAALVNGTASHALDFDDFSGVMAGISPCRWSPP